MSKSVRRQDLADRIVRHYKGKPYLIMGIVRQVAPDLDKETLTSLLRNSHRLGKAFIEADESEAEIFGLTSPLERAHFAFKASQSGNDYPGEYVWYLPLYPSPGPQKVGTWLRNIDNFIEEVEIDGQKVPRFSLIEW